jgi:hypothetical protein
LGALPFPRRCTNARIQSGATLRFATGVRGQHTLRKNKLDWKKDQKRTRSGSTPNHCPECGTPLRINVKSSADAASYY